MSVERRLTPRDPTLALSGQLDAAAVGIARRLLAREIDAVDGDVNLELSGLDFIGFGGLDVLIELSHRMAVDDRRLRIVGTSPMVDRMLEIGRIDLDAPDDTGGYVLPSPPTSGVPGGCGRHTRSGLDIRPLTPRPIARTDRMPADFTIAITDASSGGVQIAVTGELDVVTTPALRDALNEAAARGGAVALDLAEVTFIDSTALGALLEARRRFEATGGLYLSHRSPVVSRLLQLAGLANHFADEPAARSEAAVDDPIQQRLHGIISELAGVLLTATSLRDDLEQLIGFSCQALPRCSAASVALLVDGEPTTVAVSDHLALELDGVQYDNDEGPCLAALDGQRVRVDLVDADERFPHFAVGATDRRVHSVLSMPILHDHDVVGTLNFYSRDTDAFDETADHIARLASSQAANAIARSDVLTATRQRRDQLRAHYEEAAVASRAEGVLMATQSCSAEQARNLLHHAAASIDAPARSVSARQPGTASGMNEAAGPRDRGESHRFLEVYLRDHFAGATAGLALARRCRRNNAGTGLDAELAGIESEIDEDRRRLQAMMSRLGVAPSPLKSTLGSLAELVGRLKGNGRIVRPSPVSPVVELEGLAAGIVTKRNLWRSLRVAAPNHGGLDIAELDLLEERATSQLARVTTAHDRAAEGAFGPPVRSVTASELAS